MKDRGRQWKNGCWKERWWEAMKEMMEGGNEEWREAMKGGGRQ